MELTKVQEVEMMMELTKAQEVEMMVKLTKVQEVDMMVELIQVQAVEMMMELIQVQEVEKLFTCELRPSKIRSTGSSAEGFTVCIKCSSHFLNKVVTIYTISCTSKTVTEAVPFFN